MSGIYFKYGSFEGTLRSPPASRRTPVVVVAKKPVRRKCDFEIDILECPICTEGFSPPVYQCENGHSVCSACCQRIENGCPSCSEPIGRIRNIAIEKVIESLQVECKHVNHGCNVMVKYTEREKHESNSCEYRPIPCPLTRLYPTCTYTGPKAKIPEHLKEGHRTQIVECTEGSRWSRGSLKIGWNSIAPTGAHVMFTCEGIWLLVCRQKSLRGDTFHCESVGASKEVVSYKLRVAPVCKNRISRKVYSMTGIALGERGDASTWDEDCLLVPGGFEEHDIEVKIQEIEEPGEGAAASSGATPLSTNRLPIDEVIDKVAVMGFSKDQVRAVVRRLTENGQSVDLGIVLDKLMNGEAGPQQNKGGWFQRG